MTIRELIQKLAILAVRIRDLLILTLLVSGLVVHGTLPFIGFGRAVVLHETAGLAFIILAVPMLSRWTLRRGSGAKEESADPVRRIASRGLLLVILPWQALTGLLSWGAVRWPAIESLCQGGRLLALLHTAGTFVMLSFLIVYLYAGSAWFLGKASMPKAAR